jgi:predicted metal-dependent RNase
MIDESGETVSFQAAMPAKEIGLSSHADEPGILEYARLLEPSEVALVHGEPAAQQRLRGSLASIYRAAEIHCGPQELAVSETLKR